MSNPSLISGVSLVPGVPQAFNVVVLANAVQADGTNPGTPDTTTPITFDGIQNAGPAAPIAVVPSVDPTNNRRVIITTGPGLVAGGTSLPWSFRVKAAGRSGFLTVTGSSAAPADASGVFGDGNPPGPA
jgi:hypothetical protein